MGQGGEVREHQARMIGRHRMFRNARSAKCAFRNAVTGGPKVSLWVINCLADHRAARQLDLQHRTRRRIVGPTVSG
jgi:hypothetical protein